MTRKISAALARNRSSAGICIDSPLRRPLWPLALLVALGWAFVTIASAQVAHYSFLVSLSLNRNGLFRRWSAKVALAALLCLGTTGAWATNTCTVTSTADTNINGTLRYCLNNLASGSAASTNTINFSVTGTITLTSTLPDIENGVTIDGPGANQLTISGANSYLVLSIGNGNVNLRGLTVANGNNVNAGGLLDNSSGTVIINQCAFVNNTSTGGLSAGAITFGGSGTLELENSTFTGNSDAIYGASGAVTSVSGTNTLNVVSSTFYNNSGSFGGAVGNDNGPMTVVNSTFYSNSGSVAEAIYASGTSTVANNIFVNNTAGPAAVAGNTSQTTLGGNVYFNNAGGDCFNCTNAGTVVTNAGGIDAASNPLTLPLGYYGGTTETYLPQPGSAAICAGSPTLASAASLSTDQRGFPMNPSYNSCAAGSVDAGAVQTNYIQVQSGGDAGTGASDCNPTSSSCTLRDAVELANTAGGDIDFASGVSSIMLSSALELSSTAGVTIIGPGASSLAVNGGGPGSNIGVFTVDSGGMATLYGLTIANGNSVIGSGGGINNEGWLTVMASAVSGNTAVGSSGLSVGGILNGGTLALAGSTISGNTAVIGSSGLSVGGILNSGTLALTESTVSGNTASCSGVCVAAASAGGIYSGGTLTLSDSTVSGNSASCIGGLCTGAVSTGGIELAGGTLTAANSIVAGDAGGDCSNCGTLGSSNLVGGTPALTALQYNGIGATLQTMIPLPGSPAICAGSASLVPSGTTTDERGYPLQPSGGYCASGSIDAGAVQTNYTGVEWVQQPTTGYALLAISPAPTVEVLETDTLLSSNNADAVNGVPVTITFNGPGLLNGTLTETTSGGVATYSNLVATDAAMNDTLETSPITVTSGVTLPAVISSSFDEIGTISQIVVSAPSTAAAGTPFNVTVTAEDAAGNTVTNYSGEAEIFSTDGTITDPILVALASGTVTFPATLHVAATQTITAMSFPLGLPPSFSGTSGNIAVSAGPATRLAFTTAPPGNLAAGLSPGTAMVSVYDAYGNPEAGSGATVTLTVNGPSSYSRVYTATESGGVATFSGLPALSVQGLYTYTATDAPDGLTQAVATENVAVSYSVTVVSSGSSSGGSWVNNTWTPTAAGSTVLASDVESHLAAGPAAIAAGEGKSDPGNIAVEAPISWSANSLTLTASHDITIDAALQGTGAAALALQYGQGEPFAGNTGTYRIHTPVSLQPNPIDPTGTANFSTKRGSDGPTIGRAVPNCPVTTRSGTTYGCSFLKSSNLTTLDIEYETITVNAKPGTENWIYVNQAGLIDPNWVNTTNTLYPFVMSCASSQGTLYYPNNIDQNLYFNSTGAITDLAGLAASTTVVRPCKDWTDGPVISLFNSSEFPNGLYVGFVPNTGAAGIEYQNMDVLFTQQPEANTGYLAVDYIVDLPLNLVVNTAADDASSALASNCSVQPTAGTTTNADTCTLRDALLEAASLGAANITFDSTVFATPQTITAASTLTVPSNTTITGPTTGSGYTLANLVTVAGGGPSSNFSVFTVASGVAGAAIGNLTITNGNNTTEANGVAGGGINNLGTLTVTNSTFSNNSSIFGGAISSAGTLTVNGSVFSNNSAISNSTGGAILSTGSLTVTNSTFSGNSAGQGGGIYNAGGGSSLTVTDSTFTNNSASEIYGGGIYNAGGALTVTDSTFFNNSAHSGGGGIYADSVSSLTTIVDSTISGNSAHDGGGIYVHVGSVVLENTIVAGNTAGSTNADIYGSYTDNGGNLADNVGSATSPINPNLAPLGNYGGPTQTMIPLPGSPAICGGLASNIPAGETTDQRGEPVENTTYPGYTSSSPCVDSGAVQTNYGLQFTTEPQSSVLEYYTLNPAPVVGLTESGVAFAASSGTVAMTDTSTYLGGTTSEALTSGSASFGNLAVNPPGNQPSSYSNDVLTATLPLDSLVSITAQSTDIQVSPWVVPTVTATTSSGVASSGTLTSPSATFYWNNGAGYTQFRLDVGTIVNESTDLYYSGVITGTSATVPIPADGVDVYVTLHVYINGKWVPYHYNSNFKEPGTEQNATLSAPGSNTGTNPPTLLASQTFTWTGGAGPSEYQLWVGTINAGTGYSNVYDSGVVPNTVTSVNVPIPQNGAKIYVTLRQFVNGAWKSTVYTFLEPGATKPATLTATVSPGPSPASSGTLTSPATLYWNNGSGVTEYALLLGTTGQGSSNLYDSGDTTAISAVNVAIPSNGVTVFATLKQEINGVWQTALHYTFTEPGTEVNATLSTSPTAPATINLTSPDTTFYFIGGVGPTEYYLWLGTGTTGAKQYNVYKGTVGTATQAAVTTIPNDGANIYATLFQLFNGKWTSTSYTLTAPGSPTYAQLSPSSGTLSTSQKFTWTGGKGPTEYQLLLGTDGAGSSNLYVGAETTATSATVAIPPHGGTVYATLNELFNGTWQSFNYTFTEP
jgi:hypothetical protein